MLTYDVCYDVFINFYAIKIYTGMRMSCREFSGSIKKSAGQDFQTLKIRAYPQHTHRFTKTAVKCSFLNRFSKK